MRDFPFYVVLSFTTALLMCNVPMVDGMNEPRLLEDGTVCVEGFVMDKFCVETLGWLLDKGTNFPALEHAETHSVHCMVDVKDCVDSGFEVLSGEKNSDGLYERLVTLDAAGNTKVVELARYVGSCGSCVDGYTSSKQKEGFRAVVIGTMDDDSDADDPPIMKVSQVLPSSDGCPNTRTTASPENQPTSSPTRSPSRLPTRNPTFPPTRPPSRGPTAVPTKAPTPAPTPVPTAKPTTRQPTQFPTSNPTLNPTRFPTRRPSRQPTASAGKTKKTCEDYKKDRCKKEKTNCRWSASGQSCIARKNNTNKKCEDIKSRNKCKKTRKRCKWNKKKEECKERSS